MLTRPRRFALNAAKMDWGRLARHERSASRLALALLVFVALGLRLMKVNWDEGHAAHPDERHIVMVTATLQWPERLQDLLDPRATTLSPFSRPDSTGQRRPERFAYGHFPLYLLKAVTSGLQWLSRPARALLGPQSGPARELLRMTDHQHMTLVGRVISALFDAGTVLLVYAIGRRLFGRRAGLLAAALLTFTVLHVQLAHFYAVDTLLAFFVTLTLYWLLRLSAGEGRRAAIWAGVSLALAVACKTSAAPLAFAWGLAFLQRGRGSTRRENRRLMLLSAGAGAITFALVSPYVLLDFKLFLDSIGFESRMVQGAYDLPYTRQYRRTLAFVYPVLQQLRWGMGWLPGSLAVAGLGWGLWRLARRGAFSGEALLLAWCLPYFLLTGGFTVKFIRYMAPLVPALLVLGSGLLAHVAQHRRLKAVAWGAAGLALAYAVLWTWAFTAIYRTDFSRREASAWIYRNIPPGSVTTDEEWDDRLPYPLTLDGQARSSTEYEIISFPLQEPDDLGKVEMLVDRLSRADYIVIASNRFYGWLPRLRERYPVSSGYYELLFAGRLGFRLERVFASYPRLGPLQIVDDRADESFTVYDHPKVLVFRRTTVLPEEELRSMFLEALDRRAGASEAAELPLPMPLEQYPIVEDYSWNPWARDGLPAVAWWYLVATGLGLAAWPLLEWLLGRLWAAGWPFARILGLLLVGYTPWLLASLGLRANTVWALLAALLALAAGSAFLVYRRRTALRRLLAARWRELAWAEGLALAAYLLFTGIRWLNPDLWHPWWGGERPMEMGFLLATMRSARFPPYDPFYAGGYINYYYYGLYLVGCLIKLSGIPPEVAANLSLALFYSLALSGAAALAASLARARKLLAAAWSAVLVGILGNLDGGLHLLRGWIALGSAAPGTRLPLIGWIPGLLGGLVEVLTGAARPPEYSFWEPTRVIPDTINEFPFFSFLYGDLHPHILDMPVVLLGLAVTYALYRGFLTNGERQAVPSAIGNLKRGFAGPEAHGIAWATWGRALLLALLVGTAIATNTWDAPLLLAASGLAGLLLLLEHGKRLLLPLAVVLALITAVAIPLYLPFLRLYEPPPGGIGLTRSGSPFLHFLRVWGLYVLLSGGLSLALLSRTRAGRLARRSCSLAVRHSQLLFRPLSLLERFGAARGLMRRAEVFATSVLVAVLVLLAFGRYAGALCLVVLVLSAAVALFADSREERFVGGLMALGWLILLGSELFYLRDWLAGGSAYRMNTVFKFGVQAWLLLGVSCGALAALLWLLRRELLGGWRASAVALIVLAAVYPLLATPARVTARFPKGQPPPGTLDGLAFMRVGEYFWPDEQHPIVLAPEYEALMWLRANVRGAPVVAEAALGYYREGGSLVAAYTGLPIPLGPQHEPEQRPEARIGERGALVRELYETEDAEEASRVIAELDLSYIYLGQLERIFYGESGLAKFDRLVRDGLLEQAFSNGTVTVFRVR